MTNLHPMKLLTKAAEILVINCQKWKTVLKLRRSHRYSILNGKQLLATYSTWVHFPWSRSSSSNICQWITSHFYRHEYIRANILMISSNPSEQVMTFVNLKVMLDYCNILNALKNNYIAISIIFVK